MGSHASLIQGASTASRHTRRGDENNVELPFLTAQPHIHGAEVLFEEMVGAGVAPDTIAYHSLVVAYEKAGLWNRALEVLDVMKERRVPRDVPVYNTLIRACARGGQWELGRDLFEAMQAEGEALEPDAFTFVSLISACARSGSMELAEEYFEEMGTRGLTPGVQAYSALLTACA